MGQEYFVKASQPEEAADGEELWGYPDDYLADRDNVEAKFERVLGHLEQYTNVGRLLDVGCGPGFLLTAAAGRGWQTAGVDLNQWAVDYARDELGLEVRHGTLQGQGFETASFDAVAMMDLVEHVPNPDDLIAEAARIVQPGGAIALLTPDAGSLVSRALGSRWPEVRRPGEHTVLFSVDGLGQTLARHGFAPSGWHSVGKTSSLATLAADVAPVAPVLSARVRAWAERRASRNRVFEFDPRTKFVLYARRLANGEARAAGGPRRVPKRPEAVRTPEA